MIIVFQMWTMMETSVWESPKVVTTIVMICKSAMDVTIYDMLEDT